MWHVVQSSKNRAGTTAKVYKSVRRTAMMFASALPRHPRTSGSVGPRAWWPDARRARTAGCRPGSSGLEGVGGAVLSHRAAPAVPSAQQGLTSEFGMGSGVSPALSPPTTSSGSGGEVLVPRARLACAGIRGPAPCGPVKPHGPLVRLGCTCCHASTCRLSTQWSSAALQGALRPGKIHLG
jgi:hypothetical protein